MRKIHLYNLKQPAIIVKAETGLIYTNQTNGVACNHPSQEGFLVVLRSNSSRVFNPDYWYKEMPELNEDLYVEMEGALKNNFWNIRDIRVERSAKNQEAWVHVRFRGDFENKDTFHSGSFSRDEEEYPEYEGILTWENCD